MFLNGAFSYYFYLSLKQAGSFEERVKQIIPHEVLPNEPDRDGETNVTSGYMHDVYLSNDPVKALGITHNSTA